MHTSSVLPFSARPPSLTIPRLSLIYHHYHRSHSQSHQLHSYFHPNPLFYRSRLPHPLHILNLSNMDSSRSNHWYQGVRGGSQSGLQNRQPRVGTERQRGSPVYDPYTGFLRMEEENSRATYGSWHAGSQAPNISSRSERYMSPYGGYDMDDSSYFAHTTRLNIIGPNPNSTRFPSRRSSSMDRSPINRRKRSMSTTASSFHKIDRSCSPSPPVPLVPEKRTSPTESYMQLSIQPSLPLADPTTLRKLLVLDLNGTLLLRSAHSGGGGTRSVYVRPYLPSFRAYIFHLTTLQWLDTMVWSSAQPRNVNDMVDKCFGTYKEGFKAIWARDTLGLSSEEYYRKTQTTKDLARPWAQIPSLISNLTQSPPHPNSEIDAHVDRNDLPSVSQLQHSALTTMLVDDSPLKAVLQPWNHLCVSEYGKERRKLDVQIIDRKLERTRLAELEVRGEEEIGKGGKEENLDELLLAVIGILDTLKHEGNVAGWMRSGGLVHVGNQETILETPEIDTPVTKTTTMPMPIPTLTTKRDSSTVYTGSPSKRRRLTHPPDTVFLDEQIPALVSDSEMVPMTLVPSLPLSTAEAASSNPTFGDKDSVASMPIQSPRLWYEIPCVLSHWAQLGRKALADLGIDIVHGVVPNGNGY